MTTIKIKLKLNSDLHIDLHDGALAISTYAQVRGSADGVDADLRAALFRMAAALDDRVVAHRANAVAAGGGASAYVPPTDAEHDAWAVDPGSAVCDAVIDLNAAITSVYANKKLTGTSAGIAQEKLTAKKIALSNTDDTLTNALIVAIAPFSYLAIHP